jgi:hypothetical protein
VWLATNNDCINGAQKKGKVCWAKVVQEYEERKHHKPYEMRIEHKGDSIRKRWTYIKQETSKFCAAADHVVFHPESGMGVLAMVKKWASSFHLYT